jgi:hypothetical protein
MTWQSLQVLKTSKLWKKMDIYYRYDMLNLSDKDLEYIGQCRAKRIEKRRKAKQELS